MKRPATWHKSTRRSTLPPNWKALRGAARRRAQGRCERILPTGRRCPEEGSECHHVGDRHDHSLENLAWLCVECHLVETHRQANEAAAAVRSKLTHPGARDGRKPPGIL